MIEIIIPTIKKASDLVDLLAEIHNKCVLEHKIIVSSNERCVAYNSNRGLDQVNGEFVLKIDDDVFDFTYGFDKILIDTLIHNSDIQIVSARILNVDGTPQNTCSQNLELTPSLVYPSTLLVPFCLVAFRNDGTRFDENYQGSSFDDTDFNFQLREKYPNFKVVINNDATAKHKLESKVCRFGVNEEYFNKKWSSK
jgi:hypothetical protein